MMELRICSLPTMSNTRTWFLIFLFLCHTSLFLSLYAYKSMSWKAWDLCHWSIPKDLIYEFSNIFCDSVTLRIYWKINPMLHECHPTLVCVTFINCSFHLQIVGLNIVCDIRETWQSLDFWTYTNSGNSDSLNTAVYNVPCGALVNNKGPCW